MYAPRGLGGVKPPVHFHQLFITYYMQKEGGWVQMAFKNALVLNGRPLIVLVSQSFLFVIAYH